MTKIDGVEKMNKFEKALLGLERNSLSFGSIRRGVLELFSGLHKSLIRGQGHEFWEYRAWTSDDEFQRIDWRASLRAGANQLLIKEKHEEKQARVTIVLDLKETMDFGSQEFSKAEMALLTAAFLASVVVRSGDIVRMAVFSGEANLFFSSFLKKNVEIIRTIRRIYGFPFHSSSAQKAFRAMDTLTRTRKLKKGEIVFFVSDLLISDKALRKLSFFKRKNDLIVLWVRDICEEKPPGARVSCQGRERVTDFGDARLEEEFRKLERRIRLFLINSAIPYVKLTEKSDLIKNVKRIL